MSDSPAYDELADEDDTLSWSWDELTGGVRDEVSDEEAVGYALFAGVPEDEVQAHKDALEALGGA